MTARQDDREADQAVRRLSDTMAVVSATVQRLPVVIGERFDLHPTRLAALRSVAAGRTRVSDVADATFLSVSAASRTVDALVEEGLLDRTPDPDNRRAVTLTLTPKGEGLMEEVRDFFEGFVRGIVTEVGVARLDEVSSALATFGEHMGAQLAAYEENLDAG